MKKYIIWALVAAAIITGAVIAYRYYAKKAKPKTPPAPPTARPTNHPVGGPGAGIARQNRTT